MKCLEINLSSGFQLQNDLADESDSEIDDCISEIGSNSEVDDNEAADDDNGTEEEKVQ